MQTLFRFMPAVIYMVALFAIIASILIVRPSHVSRPFNLHCQYEKYADCKMVR